MFFHLAFPSPSFSFYSLFYISMARRFEFQKKLWQLQQGINWKGISGQRFFFLKANRETFEFIAKKL